MTTKDTAVLGLLLTASRALGAVQEAIGAAVAVIRDAQAEEQQQEGEKRGKVPPMFGE